MSTFVDFEKAFNNLDRNTLWSLMMHYSIPGKFIRIIKNSYDTITCKVVHAGKLSDSFAVKTGIKQGCLMSSFLFLLAIVWTMETTDKQQTGIQWNLQKQLGHLDFADDTALLSSNNQQIHQLKSLTGRKHS